MNKILFLLFLMTSISAVAENATVVNVEETSCQQGAHFQPNGPYAVYVFCDDALATNIAIFFDKLRVPRHGKYSLFKRFWQQGDWGSDVSSFAWLPDNHHLLVATSRVYGTGKVFKLNLESQTSEVIYFPNESVCLTEILEVENNQLSLRITDCDMEESQIKISM